ncbi:hypothetical protein Misp01_55650 [Microtetraspora sp. NBRC 13810]|uniref:hypothetical protein n=1 Tax=Microtetraspora sp. NBRC 13810 TaxID=3030990 RepID=UPI0024A460BC|nr:hypothetical protein [Microtetraspora sp. NBRC 13810]GLW10437.1 hypothetical protein Misp01_55650 [Microtetraspora sp. NBRC 13810]
MTKHRRADAHGNMVTCRQLMIFIPVAIAMSGIAAALPASASTAAIHHDFAAHDDDGGPVIIKTGSARRNQLDFTVNSPKIIRGTQSVITGDGGSAIQFGKCTRGLRTCKNKQNIGLSSKLGRVHDR